MTRRHMRLRPAACFAVLVVALAATPGQAAPLRFADPAGDSVGRQSALDIVWVEFATTGTGKGAKYVPWDLLVTMRVNNVPLKVAGVRYQVSAEVEGCDQFSLTYPPLESVLGPVIVQSGGQANVQCDGGFVDERDVKFTTEGASLKWRIPISRLAGMRVGAKFSAMTGRIEVAETMFHLPGSSLAAETFDVATTTATWVMR